MDIKIIATGSTGNCYKITADGTSLLIECGLPIRKIKEGLGFRLSEIEGCLVTHSHRDHCKVAEEIAEAGIPVFMLQSVKDSLAVDHYNINIFGSDDLFFNSEQFSIRKKCGGNEI